MRRDAVRSTLILSIASAACAPRETAPSSVVRDSAGVVVVESRQPAWGPGEGWRVGARPILRIGAVEGGPAHEFSGVTGAVRLAGGALVVADGGSQEVRFFGPDGSVRAVVGGAGEGPGEFSALAGLGRGPGERVWAWDFTLRRLTWFDASGRVVRVVSLGPEPPVLGAVGSLPDGSFVLKQLWGAQRIAEANRTGLRRDPVAYVRFDSAGTLVDTLGLFPGREVFLTEEDGRGVMTTPPFGRTSVGALWEGTLVVGDQTTFGLEQRTDDGILRRLLRITGRDVTLSAPDAEAYLEDRLEEASPESRPEVRRSFGAIPFPATRPAHGELLADASGHLWVAAWSPGPRPPTPWTVLGAGGTWLGDVEVPRGFRPWDVGGDWILGSEADELDVEHVVVYPLVKPPRRP